MANPLRSQSIKKFLELNTWLDLAEMYNAALEVQVNMAQDGGERIDRHYKGHDWHEWSDGVQTWKTFRMPRNAWQNPEDNDFEIKFDLSQHVEGIGLTGWDWVNKRSKWVAFDFDAIIGHSDRHKKKLTDQELEVIRESISKIPWVTLRKSTGGKGLHVYVFIGCVVETANHNEHMALARAILSQLSVMCNYDFESKVDSHGGIMWVWHRKMTKENRGLELIKRGAPLEQVPPNWRDHIDVVKGKRKRIIPFFVKDAEKPEETEDLFDELSSQRPKVPLDEDHKKLIEWISTNIPGGSWWVEDHWMLVTHSRYLKEAHTALKLKGIFETLATGKDYGADHNCFAYPTREGAWKVYRYTLGTAEHPTWNQDGKGWTHTFLNKLPDLKMVALANGAIEKTNGGFGFKTAKAACAAAQMLGVTLKLPPTMDDRPAILKRHKDNRLIIELEKRTGDLGDGMDGFDPDGKNWKKILNHRLDSGSGTIAEVPNLDQGIRHIVTEQGDNYGWVIRTDNQWRQEPLEHIKVALKGNMGYKPTEVEAILGQSIIQPYTLVNQPFDIEYPPGRKWNRRAAKLRFAPSQDVENLNYSTWLKIFDHLGKELDFAIQGNAWARANNVKSGADYLLIWTAALFQKPFEQLPYLFFWSEEQNTGKTAFHEALSLLMDGYPQNPRGYMRADTALQPNTTFNGELQHAIICVVEETDLNKSRTGASTSYNRIKDWVTTKQLPIHEKNKTPYLVPNTTHWIQAANSRLACPVFPGDSRITMIHVGKIDELEMIPKTKLLEMLEKEAPDFLAEILKLEIPPSNDRLYVPVISTDDKEFAQESNMTLIELYIKEHCFVIDGEMILWQDFYKDFQDKCEPQYLETWTKTYTSRHLPSYHTIGRRRQDGLYYIINISYKPMEPNTKKKSRLIVEPKTKMIVAIDEVNGNGQSVGGINAATQTSVEQPKS